jgi:hypothetical protein
MYHYQAVMAPESPLLIDYLQLTIDDLHICWISSAICKNMFPMVNGQEQILLRGCLADCTIYLDASIAGREYDSKEGRTEE